MTDFRQLDSQADPSHSASQMTDQQPPSTPPHVPHVDQLPCVLFSRSVEETWPMEYLSAGCERLTGFTPQELLAGDLLTYNALIHEDDFLALATLLHVLRSQPDPYQIEYRLRHRNNDQRWVLEQGQAVLDPTRQLLALEGVLTDITETKKAQEQLQFDAFYDQLTTLPNRSLFMDRLERVLKRTKRRPDYCFAVFFLDLDRFKVINDSLGHRAGDELLASVAKRLKDCIRPGDTVARLGGDEFTMLVDDINDMEDVNQISERVLEQMRHPFVLEGRDIYTSTSIGIALSSIGYNQPDEMLRDADIALYQAKAQGKARFAIFNPGMHIHAVARLQLENDLQTALAQQQLRLYYQPVVSLETGRVDGLEVFVYWQHPERGLVGPAEFIPVAEENGTMIAIGQWVLRESLQQVKLWHQTFPADPPLFMSVNLSASEVIHREFVDTVQQILSQTQIPPHCLKLEVAEKTFIEDPEVIAHHLQQLRTLGVKVCIDDFGTGYSALSALKQYPVDVIKIDRSFVSRLDHKENLEIVRSVIHLASSLEFQVVAEGIESVTQLAQLRALGCEWGQGYCLARPLESRLVETCLLQEPTGELTSSVSVVLPRLLVHSSTGQYHLLLVGQTSWTLGRSQESSIFLSDRMVSREHAILLQLARTGDFFFVDLGSRNGSFLNGTRIEMPVRLKEGDRLKIGKTELEYRELTRSNASEGSDFPYKLVLMHQNYNLQGEVWREILISQGVSVIWHTDDGDMLDVLEQLDTAGDKLPDVLLLEISELKPDPAAFLERLQQRYRQLKVILTSGRASEIPPDQEQWARDQGAIALLPGFNFRGNDLTTNSADIADKVQVLLDQIDCYPSRPRLLESAYVALQIVIRNETLY
ncbi:EAL domain-containing protein [Lyngbya confervoides]|uniref:EAL domain-containing protein n=1 Tax=Lyngbya confervoides BDU141951 TaxID=1574623 RepID=A0ABD4T054_9CYAN|nr:EAL domain-containing protein [Lyngbya confervoides]MCM1981949.1 EAL domain-containing protein [Lyngbya confervoides BDU141951]